MMPPLGTEADAPALRGVRVPPNSKACVREVANGAISRGLGGKGLCPEAGCVCTATAVLLAAIGVCARSAGTKELEAVLMALGWLLRKGGARCATGSVTTGSPALKLALKLTLGPLLGQLPVLPGQPGAGA